MSKYVKLVEETKEEVSESGIMTAHMRQDIAKTKKDLEVIKNRLSWISNKSPQDIYDHDAKKILAFKQDIKEITDLIDKIDRIGK